MRRALASGPPRWAYFVGALWFDEPAKSRFPSSNVMLVALAVLDPLRAWKPSITSTVPVDEALLPPATPIERVGAAGFPSPFFGLAVLADYLDVDPRVGIRPAHLGDLALQFDRLLVVILGRE